MAETVEPPHGLCTRCQQPRDAAVHAYGCGGSIPCDHSHHAFEGDDEPVAKLDAQTLTFIVKAESQYDPFTRDLARALIVANEENERLRDNFDHVGRANQDGTAVIKDLQAMLIAAERERNQWHAEADQQAKLCGEAISDGQRKASEWEMKLHEAEREAAELRKKWEAKKDEANERLADQIRLRDRVAALEAQLAEADESIQYQRERIKILEAALAKVREATGKLTQLSPGGTREHLKAAHGWPDDPEAVCDCETLVNRAALRALCDALKGGA